MPAAARPSILRKMLEDQFSLLAAELVALYEQELAAREAETRQEVRDELAEMLNQTVRRLRSAADFTEAAGILADSSATYCKVLAVFSVEGETLHAERVRGLTVSQTEQFCSLDLRVAEAAAIAGVIESGDPVVAMTTPREISAALTNLLEHKADDRAYILPVQVRGKAIGILYAAGAVEMAPLELLAQAAALAAETRTAAEAPRAAEPARRPELVMIQGSKPEPRTAPDSWSQLTAEEQEIHLRAQRFARVQVAGMRLFTPELVEQGRKSKDLYSALRKDIDAGREIFRQSFLSANATMLDYFHVELLHRLANDDVSLLGVDYPGPMV